MGCADGDLPLVPGWLFFLFFSLRSLARWKEGGERFRPHGIVLSGGDDGSRDLLSGQGRARKAARGNRGSAKRWMHCTVVIDPPGRVADW